MRVCNSVGSSCICFECNSKQLKVLEVLSDISKTETKNLLLELCFKQLMISRACESLGPCPHQHGYFQSTAFSIKVDRLYTCKRNFRSLKPTIFIYPAKVKISGIGLECNEKIQQSNLRGGVTKADFLASPNLWIGFESIESIEKNIQLYIIFNVASAFI